jgi:hypothetical protein
MLFQQNSAGVTISRLVENKRYEAHEMPPGAVFRHKGRLFIACDTDYVCDMRDGSLWPMDNEESFSEYFNEGPYAVEANPHNRPL